MPLGRIGHYEILEKLGQGGMGVVFKARDIHLDRFAALKILPEALTHSHEARARLRREARAEAALNHPNIAVCYEIAEGQLEPPNLMDDRKSPSDQHEPVLFLAMEYVGGVDLLSTVSGRKHRLAEILRLAAQVVSGLEAAHRSGVVHRDLKPTNILVSGEGAVKILDFGLAKILDAKHETGPDAASTQSSEGRVVGTAAYMSPEQATGDPVDQRSDLFSFGIVLYELVTGRLPFTGTTYLETLRSRVHEEASPLARYASGIPEELERIIRKLLARDLAARYQSAHEVATDLNELIRRMESGEHRIAARTRRKGRLRGGILLAVPVLVLAFWFLIRGRDPGQSGPTHPALAVLPFVNMTGDVNLDYVSEGIAAGVLSEIVQWTDYNVVSQSTAWSYRGAGRTPAEISRELGVGSLLEGTMHRHGDGVRVDVRLVNALTGMVIWSERFVRGPEGLLKIEENITARVVGALSGTGGPPVRGGRTRSPEAYETYLRAGRYLDDADDPRGPDTALRLYEEATRLDPDFAVAWAGQSKALWKLYFRDKEPNLLHRAEETAERAVKIQPDLLEARLARAQTYRGTGRHELAIAELTKVLSINPNWDEAHLQLAASYRDAGDLDRAEQSCRRAIALRPEYWRNWNSLGGILLRKGESDGAALAFREIIRLIPDKNRGYEQLAAVELGRGRFDDAISIYARLPAPVNDGPLATNVGTAYFYAGQMEKALEFYRKAVELEPRNQVCRHNLGDLYSKEGKTADARREYREALRLSDEQLASDPDNLEVSVQRVIFLSKLGECEASTAELDRIANLIPVNDAECAHTIARAHAVCQDTTKALASLRRAISLGIPGDYIRREEEFRVLRDDPEYQALINSARKS